MSEFSKFDPQKELLALIDGQAAEIERLAAEVVRLREALRWNIDKDGDDLLICDGSHEKGEKCQYVRYVRALSQKESTT